MIGADDRSLVAPFYLRLLHGNFVARAAPTFLDALRDALPRADADAIDLLLRQPNWRPRLCAAWFIGLRRLDGFDDRLADLLIRSDVCYAGQGYCVARARRATPVARAALQAYLRIYLPVGDRVFDQPWALGALAHIDPTAAITCEPSAWKPFDPQHGIDRVAQIMTVLADAGL